MCKKHISPFLFQRVIDIYPLFSILKIGLATIYRNLKVFEDLGIVKEIPMDYIKLNQKVEKKKGLEVNDANITLLGLCKECREKLKD